MLSRFSLKEKTQTTNRFLFITNKKIKLSKIIFKLQKYKETITHIKFLKTLMGHLIQSN